MWTSPAFWQTIAAVVSTLAIAAFRFWMQEKRGRRTDTEIIHDAAHMLENLLDELAAYRPPSTPTPVPEPKEDPRTRLKKALQAAKLGARPDGTGTQR